MWYVPLCFTFLCVLVSFVFYVPLCFTFLYVLRSFMCYVPLYFTFLCAWRSTVYYVPLSVTLHFLIIYLLVLHSSFIGAIHPDLFMYLRHLFVFLQHNIPYNI